MPEWSPTVKRAWSPGARSALLLVACGTADPLRRLVREKLPSALELALAWGYYWNEVCDGERRPWNWVKAIEYDIPQPQSRLRTSDSMVSP
jgi:hypothetical protein